MFEVAIAPLTSARTSGVTDDAARLDAIRELETLACAARARQAELAAELDRSRPDPAVASELAQARRESPHRARQHLGLARILTTEMPHTMAAFRAGAITEWKATILVRETAYLTLADRRRIDRSLAADAARLERMGDRELQRAAQQHAARLDPASVIERRRRAESERAVTLRPAPDTMTYLTALLPVEQGVAAYAALKRAADSARAAGDQRGQGQVMADTLVERLTGQADASDVPVRVNLVVSDQTLFGDGEDSALVEGSLPMPAEIAREWVSEATDKALRRLYARPRDGQLVAMESRSRCFPDGLAQLIRFRDQVCATPWCDAPIRHLDHVVPHADGGPTSLGNGQGLCEACNHAKQTTGWQSADGHDPPRPAPWQLPTRAEFFLRSFVLAT